MMARGLEQGKQEKHKLILQDRMYGKADHEFLHGLSSDIQVVDDPDAFQMTDQTTFAVPFGSNSGYIYQPEQYPAVIPSHELNALEAWGRKGDGSTIDTKDLEKMGASYTEDSIAKKGQPGFNFNDVYFHTRRDLVNC